MCVFCFVVCLSFSFFVSFSIYWHVKEVSFDSERKNPANASVDYDKDRVTENEKKVPIIKSGFLWNQGEPAVRTLETTFAGAKLNTNS